MSLFTETISAAVADFAEHGYDSETRLADWVERIRSAAESELVPESVVEEELRSSLSAIYARLVDRGGILKYHPGVDRFTLDMVRPALRDELSRRVMASANLIKLNREQAIQETLQRFSGWASSVPPGGSDVVRSQKVQASTRQEFAQLGFRERRVAIDQGHKFMANLSQVLATGSAAIAATWHQHYTRFPRDTHKTRDGRIYLVRGSWADERGLVRPGPAGYTDEVTQPGEEVLCLPGDALIDLANDIEVAYRRWFSGDLAEIVTESGKALRATPNHPVLTPRGWAPIGSLNEGDYVIEVSDEVVGTRTAKLDDDDAVPLVSQVFDACYRSGVSVRVGGRSRQFHGDGSDGNVDVVLSTWPLGFRREPVSGESVKQLRLAVSTYSDSERGDIFQLFLAALLSAGGLLSRTYHGLSLFWSRRFPPHAHGFAAGAHSYASRLESSENSRPRDSELLSYVSWADPACVQVDNPLGIDKERRVLPGMALCTHGGDVLPSGMGLDYCKTSAARLVAGVCRLLRPVVGTVVTRGPPVRPPHVVARIVRASRLPFVGHVYNFQTCDGWYVADGIITHNCRCTYTYINALRRLPSSMLTQKGREELLRVRGEVTA